MDKGRIEINFEGNAGLSLDTEWYKRVRIGHSVRRRDLTLSIWETQSEEAGVQSLAAGSNLRLLYLIRRQTMTLQVDA